MKIVFNIHKSPAMIIMLLYVLLFTIYLNKDIGFFHLKYIEQRNVLWENVMAFSHLIMR